MHSPKQGSDTSTEALKAALKTPKSLFLCNFAPTERLSFLAGYAGHECEPVDGIDANPDTVTHSSGTDDSGIY